MRKQHESSFIAAGLDSGPRRKNNVRVEGSHWPVIAYSKPGISLTFGLVATSNPQHPVSVDESILLDGPVIKRHWQTGGRCSDTSKKSPKMHDAYSVKDGAWAAILRAKASLGNQIRHPSFHRIKGHRATKSPNCFVLDIPIWGGPLTFVQATYSKIGQLADVTKTFSSNKPGLYGLKSQSQPNINVQSRACAP